MRAGRFPFPSSSLPRTSRPSLGPSRALGHSGGNFRDQSWSLSRHLGIFRHCQGTRASEFVSTAQN